MKLQLIGAIALIAGTSIASGQAITGFTGGSQYGSYYGGAFAGDVIGFRFDVNSDIIVTDLGVWNADTQLMNEGLTSDHLIGLWDSAGTLLTSTTAGPAGTVVGDWTYAATANVTLTVGNTYTIGALYNAGGVADGDSYISGASAVFSSADINWINSVYPDAADGGFAFPGLDSASSSGGRFGPNFLYGPVPAPGSVALLGLGGLVATRRRR